MKTMTMGFLVLLSVTAGTAWAEDPVYFASSALKAEMERILGVSDPTPSDMLNLPTDLYINYKGISDLTGLEYALNLRVLYCYGNGITNLSPLAELPHLTDLVFSHGNNVADISPLANLTSLRYLNFEGNQVVDLSPLAGLTQLQRLYADHNRIVDISALSALSQLDELEIDQNRIVDISVLAGLHNLNVIDLDNNRIQDISPLVGFSGLTKFEINANPLNSESCEVYLPILIAKNPGIVYSPCTDPPPTSTQYTLNVSSGVGGSVIVPGEGISGPYTAGSLVTVQAAPEPGYVFSEWTGSAVTAGMVNSADQPETTVMLQGNYTLKANFVEFTSLILYVDDDAAGDPLENGMPNHPFDHIQEAIEAAADGASIQIYPGTYYETIDFQGKTLKLIGLDPNDPNADSLPVIDGQGTGPVVSFVSGEEANSLLQGCVVTGGGVAIQCMNSYPTLSHCLIVGNQPGEFSDAVIDCSAGGLKVVHCTIAFNRGGIKLINSGLDVSNSIVWGNMPNEIVVIGNSFALISYSNVPPSNHPFLVGVENIYLDPLFVEPGYWVDMIWFMGDYHLQSQAGRWHEATQSWITDDMTSPCVDAGDPNDSVGNESNPHGNRINMGVYGRTGVASRSYVSGNGIVYFADPILKAKVEEALSVVNPTVTDMMELDALEVRQNYIKDVTGLEYALNLQTLNLRGNSVTSILPIVGLSQLLVLDLSDNRVADISAFSGMTQLRELDIHGNGISDISPLSNLTALKKLVLKKNNLTGGVFALEYLTNLEELELQENDISGINGLYKMAKLKRLDLSQNTIRNIGVLSDLTSLERLDLEDNLVSNIASLTGLTQLRTLNLKGNPLNQEAYDSHLQMIIDNNPGIQISYDPSP